MVIGYPSPSAEPALDVYGFSYVLFDKTPREQLAGWLFIKWLLESENIARLVDATSTFPIRESALDHLGDLRERLPQWVTATGLLRSARHEPQDASWATIRWALSDASRQLFLYYFTSEQVDELLEFLDKTVLEIQQGPRESGLYNTATFTPSPTFTPSITPSSTPTRVPSSTPVPTDSPQP